MEKKSIRNYEISDRQMYIIVGVMSIFVFINIFGYRILNPFNTDWMMEGGDLTLAYLSVKGYLNSDWHFPIGLIDTIAYPFNVPIIFEDALGLFAVPQKILYTIIPKDLQFFGLWGFMSYILQGILTAKILKNFSKNKYFVIVATILFLYIPSMLFRAYAHVTLIGHWSILLTLELLFLSEKYIDDKKMYYRIVLIGICSPLIHIYFILINGIILCGVCLEDILKNKRFKKSIYILATYLCAVVVTVYLLGGFSLLVDTAGGGLGTYSFNLNGLFNPQTPVYAQVFQPMPQSWGQYEGFAYLGAGCIFLMFYSLLTIFEIPNIKQTIKNNRYKIIAIGVIFIGSFIFALSPVVTLNDRVVLDYTNLLPRFVLKLWATFRGTGRVAWILVYIIMFGSVILTFKKENNKTIALVLVFCVGIQIYDLQPLIKSKNLNDRATVEYNNSLVNNEFCNNLLENNEIKHVTLSEQYKGEGQHLQDLYTVSYWAFENDMTMNTFYIPRVLGKMLDDEIVNSLTNPTPDTIYVFYGDKKMDCLNYDLNYYKVDNFIFGYINEIEGYTPLVLPRDVYTVYEIGTDIAFCGETYNANEYVVSGIRAQEGAYSWTNSDYVDIKFIGDTNPNKLKCFIELKDVFTGTQDVTILINEEEVYHQVVNAGENIEFEFDNSNNVSGLFNVDILLPGAISPSELGPSDDTSKLALAINHITFTEVNE